MVNILKTNHKIYELKFHFVLIIKYRKSLFSDKISKFCETIFFEIAERYDFEIETVGYDETHVHLLLSNPDPNKYSLSKLFQLLKGISSRELFKQFPDIKKELWGGEFWSNGGYVGTVGEGKNAEIIRKYIKKQGLKDNNLKLIDFL